MKRLILLTTLASLLAGCTTASKAPQPESQTRATTAVTNKKMASDIATKMSALYPAARSKLTLRQASADPFGSALADALRTKGYALSEHVGPDATGASTKAVPGVGDLNLSYVVDQPLGLIRVTVFINAQSLSRLYEANDRGVSPAGYWVRKE